MTQVLFLLETIVYDLMPFGDSLGFTNISCQKDESEKVEKSYASIKRQSKHFFETENFRNGGKVNFFGLCSSILHYEGLET